MGDAAFALRYYRLSRRVHMLANGSVPCPRFLLVCSWGAAAWTDVRRCQRGLRRRAGSCAHPSLTWTISPCTFRYQSPPPVGDKGRQSVLVREFGARPTSESDSGRSCCSWSLGGAGSTLPALGRGRGARRCADDYAARPAPVLMIAAAGGLSGVDED